MMQLLWLSVVVVATTCAVLVVFLPLRVLVDRWRAARLRRAALGGADLSLKPPAADDSSWAGQVDLAFERLLGQTGLSWNAAQALGQFRPFDPETLELLNWLANIDPNGVPGTDANAISILNARMAARGCLLQR